MSKGIRVKRSAFVLLTTIALMACKREQSTPSTTGLQASAPLATGTVAPAAVNASAAPAPVAPAGLFAEQLPKGLPEFDRTPVELDVMNRSTGVDTEADKARKRKDYAKAIELYVEALKVDPGNRGARYYLASTLVLNGQLEAGLGVIDQFYRAEDCYPCKGLLFEMTQDKDFAPVRARPEFK